MAPALQAMVKPTANGMLYLNFIFSSWFAGYAGH
jgi:hypothetical protein